MKFHTLIHFATGIAFSLSSCKGLVKNRDLSDTIVLDKAGKIVKHIDALGNKARLSAYFSPEGKLLVIELKNADSTDLIYPGGEYQDVNRSIAAGKYIAEYYFSSMTDSTGINVYQFLQRRFAGFQLADFPQFVPVIDSTFRAFGCNYLLSMPEKRNLFYYYIHNKAAIF